MVFTATILLSLACICGGIPCYIQRAIDCATKNVESFRVQKSRCEMREAEIGCMPDECDYEQIKESITHTLCKCLRPERHFMGIHRLVSFGVICDYNSDLRESEQLADALKVFLEG